MTIEVVDWNNKKVFNHFKGQLGKNMTKATTLVKRETVAKLRSTRSPSPEGGPPGKDTGDLARAVKKKTRKTKHGITGVVGILDDPVQAAKGARLHGGFVGRDRDGRLYSQGPRPWLPPVIRANDREILRILTEGA